jgi:nicotinamide-nucleotide amidase
VDAALIAVGSELLRPGARDTNAEWLTGRLESLGARVRWRALVDDSTERIAVVTEALFGRSDLLILTGGLGPTEDDRTRPALAQALGVPSVRDPERLERLLRYFRDHGRVPSGSQARQADRPRGSEWLENPVGSAPGIAFESGSRLLFALPGVPAEMRAMFDESIAPRLRARAADPPARRTLRVAGRTESAVDEMLRDLYQQEGVEVTILAKPTGIELLLAASGGGAAEASSRLALLEERMSGRLGADLFGKDDDSLASVVGALLVARGETVATAESCTAGLLAAALTEVPGASAWYRGGLVVYSDDLKRSLAGVSEETLAAHGAVSAPVALELAAGARSRCAADHGVGVTGIAGPSGGTDAKPVGLVHMAVASPGVEREARFVFRGDRDLIRARAASAALDLLRRGLRGA